MAESVTLKSIALDVEHTAVGGDVHLVGAVICAALKLEEAGGTALLEVGLGKDKAGNLGLGGGEDICGDFVFWSERNASRSIPST